MAPLTPQGNSRLPKSPNVGGPVPMSGLLGRRSLLPSPHTTHSSSSTSEYQAQMEFNHISSTGMAQDETPLPTAFSSPVNHSNNTVASPLALRNSTIKTRRPSAPREITSDGIHSRGTPTLTSPQPGHLSNLSGKYSRSNSLSGMSPPLQQQQQQQHMTSFSASSSSSSSPTESSPSARTSLTARLSTGTGSSVAAARAAYMKQPLFQRPTTSPSGGPPVPGSGLSPTGTLANKNSVSSNPVSPVYPPVTASVSAERADNMPQVGDRVMVESMGLTGYLRFMGTAAFKSGVWAGIELDTPTGKNDGTVAGYV